MFRLPTHPRSAWTRGACLVPLALLLAAAWGPLSQLVRVEIQTQECRRTARCLILVTSPETRSAPTAESDQASGSSENSPQNPDDAGAQDDAQSDGPTVALLQTLSEHLDITPSIGIAFCAELPPVPAPLVACSHRPGLIANSGSLPEAQPPPLTTAPRGPPVLA